MDLTWSSQFGCQLGKRARSSTSSNESNENGELEPLDVITGDRVVVLIDGSVRYGVVHGWKGPSNNFSQGFWVNVIWEGQSQPEVTLLRRNNFLVLDRLFSIGQRVCLGERCGTIVRRSDSVSLRIHNSNHLILSDSPVSSLEPLTKLFHGVFIEYMGWFGLIAEVVRRVRVEFDPERVCHVFRREPVVMRPMTNGLIGKKKKKDRCCKSRNRLNRTYPFIVNRCFPTSDVPVNGSIIRLMGKHLSQVVNTFPELSNENVLTGKVLSSDVVNIAVDWFAPIPGVPETSKPNMSLGQNEIPKVRYFYIHPCRYFSKDGLCKYTVRPTDDIIHTEEFEQRLAYALETGKNYEDCESPEKRKKFESRNLRVPPTLVVRKHIVRHQFDVRFDKSNEITTVYGSDLQPWCEEAQQQKHFQPPYFVRKKDSSEANIYGIILRQYTVSDSGIQAKVVMSVQWLEEKNGSVEPLSQTNEENSLDITLHQEYNALSAGTHVARTENIPDSQENGFLFGTILAIDRYNFGKVTVYCSVEMTEKLMWPFQLQRIQYEKFVPSMTRVERKFVCPDSPRRICRGADGQNSSFDPFKEDRAFILKSEQLGCHDFSAQDSGSESESEDEDFDKTSISELARQASEAAKAYMVHASNPAEPVDTFDGKPNTLKP